MSMGKKKTETTKKKGMALSDDARAAVTGGIWKVTYTEDMIAASST